MQVPRTIFREAIEAGIKAHDGNCEPMTNGQRNTLRELAETTTRVGTNFARGCPAALVGLVGREGAVPWNTEPSPRLYFAHAYDRVIGTSTLTIADTLVIN